MRIRINRLDLLTALQRVQGVVEKRNTMPILAHVLLEAKSEGLDILATDLEIGMRGLYKASVEEPGSIAFSAKKLLEILKETNEAEIELTVNENNWMTIQAGRSEFRVVGLPSQDYPSLPTIERDGLMPLPSVGLLNLIQKTLFAVGESDTRYVLNGLLTTIIPLGEKLIIRLVGTDGHRLALAEQEITPEGSFVPLEEIKVIIPKKAALEVRRLLEENDKDEEPLIGVSKNMLIFRKSGLVLTSRTMEGTYPNYQQVIPKENPSKMVVGKEELTGALRRVSLLSRDRAQAIKFSVVQNTLTLSASSPDLGEATEDLPIQCQGQEFTTGFNARYLLDVLGVLDGDTLSIQMDTPLSPCLIQEPGNARFKAVVMPIKV